MTKQISQIKRSWCGNYVKIWLAVKRKTNYCSNLSKMCSCIVHFNQKVGNAFLCLRRILDTFSRLGSNWYEWNSNEQWEWGRSGDAFSYLTKSRDTFGPIDDLPNAQKSITQTLDENEQSIVIYRVIEQVVKYLK
jgi:hypothetical protein